MVFLYYMFQILAFMFIAAVSSLFIYMILWAGEMLTLFLYYYAVSGTFVWMRSIVKKSYLYGALLALFLV